MTDIIRGDVLTSERIARKDVRIQEGDRGGLAFYVPSYLDILLDNDVITESHKVAGSTYWSIKEAAMKFLATRPNPLFADVTGENNEAHDVRETDEGEPIELFMCIKLKYDTKRLIDACCNHAHGNALAIVWAFGVNAITNAFDELENELPNAREKLKHKLENKACIYA